MVSDILIETHVVDLCHVNEPMVTLAKRYSHRLDAPKAPGVGLQDSKFKTAYTLVCLHALGHHKEMWEPVISRLFALDSLATSGHSIAEIWAIDCPDHGESAALNSNVPAAWLRSGRVSCRSYGGVIPALIRSGLMRAPSASRLVLIGHSAGSIGVILSTTYPPAFNDIPIFSIILVEPWIIHPDIAATSAELRAIVNGLSQSGLRRRDVWPSRKEAQAYFKSKSPWMSWDADVLELYVKYGLSLLSSKSSPHATQDVTLSYPRHKEGAAYADNGEGQDALKRLPELCSSIPMHVILGGDQPPITKTVQEVICSSARSVTIVPKTGHMAPQQSHKQVAEAIWRVLAKESCSLPVSEAKL